MAFCRLHLDILLTLIISTVSETNISDYTIGLCTAEAYWMFDRGGRLISQSTNTYDNFNHTACVTHMELLPTHDAVSSTKASVVYFRIRVHENGIYCRATVCIACFLMMYWSMFVLRTLCTGKLVFLDF